MRKNNVGIKISYICANMGEYAHQGVGCTHSGGTLPLQLEANIAEIQYLYIFHKQISSEKFARIFPNAVRRMFFPFYES